MRHNHPRRGPCERVQPEANVEISQRNHPQLPERNRLPGANHLQERSSAGSPVEIAHHHRPPRLRGSVQKH